MDQTNTGQAKGKDALGLPPLKRLGNRMNKTELAFAQKLEQDHIVGENLWWGFESIRLRLGSGAYYKPDFMVLDADRTITFIEVKGHWREAARVRIKTIAELFPMFKFEAVKRGSGTFQWDYEEF